MAQVRFLEGEEAYAAYAAAPLRLPLAPAIAAKQKKLDETMTCYKRSVDFGVDAWSNASTYRIGQALVAFGEALDRSERPADLQGGALVAYEDVLRGHSQALYDRGEAVWSDLLRQKGREAQEDEWITKAQNSLWRRLGGRFFYRPEVEFPTLSGTPPEKPRSEKERKSPQLEAARGDSALEHDLAERKGSEP